MKDNIFLLPTIFAWVVTGIGVIFMQHVDPDAVNMAIGAGIAATVFSACALIVGRP